jgi:hypothetical protein
LREEIIQAHPGRQFGRAFLVDVIAVQGQAEFVFLEEVGVLGDGGSCEPNSGDECYEFCFHAFVWFLFMSFLLSLLC